MIGPILELINKFVPDKDTQEKIKAELDSKGLDIIKKEMESPAGLWRPRFAYLCMFMILMQYILFTVVPYIVTVFNLDIWTPVETDLSTELWITIRVCLGGYIGARSIERVASIWKK